MNKEKIINALFDFSDDIRYAAIYSDQDLLFRQKQNAANSSAEESDKYEELLVNPSLLTIARQRGNIDCGGLRFIIVAYGNFYQLIKEIKGGHISICLVKTADLTLVPQEIFDFLKENFGNEIHF